MTPRPPAGIPPRELLLSGHPYAITDEGLLSVLLGGRGAQRIQRHFGTEGTEGLWDATAEDLIGLDGVGPAGAARLLACLEVSRRVGARRCSVRPNISTPEDVVAVCGPQLRGLDREHFWTLALNTKNRLIRIIEVSVGSLNASIVHPRELYKDAVRVSAASIVVVHNHPSGDPTPSGADIQLTKRIVKAGDVLGIEVLDHVIIGGGGEHASMRDLGLM